ncbi:MAG: NAD(P)/FAD-dependent oxidoreductase [Bacteroidales bacterium]|jgi:phytoene dehydrogenase-like protein
MNTNDNSIIIIGAGFAGLSAGIYAQMNGYKTRIFELHDKPGGLCTSWKRNGFTIDGCIHWLVGSSPESGMYEYWKEVGLAQGREFIYPDEYMRFEGSDGRNLIIYTDIDRLQKHLIEFSPQDEDTIYEFIRGIRLALNFDQPSKNTPFFKRLSMLARLLYTMTVHGKKLQKWMKTTSADFAGRFRDPILRQAFMEMWIPEFSMFFMLFMFSYMHKKNAGYPLGGSLPMSEALEARYRSLGGIINYGKRVEKILIENDKATGIRLSEGSEFHASRVISAADGHSTIFKMLDGIYTDEKIRETYEKWPRFPSIILAGFGINRTFSDVPVSVSGFSFKLERPVVIGDKTTEWLPVRIYNQDPSLAPAGKTVLSVLLDSDYEYWNKLSEDREAYNRKKEETAKQLVGLLELRFPGIGSQVEMINIATPKTFERYTGNWNGCFEGWLVTPQNSNVMMKPMSQTLPGLHNFHMCGQWVEPGGGLPTGVMSARRLLKSICKEDGKKFTTKVP